MSCLDYPADPFGQGSKCGRALLRDLAVLIRLHDREMDGLLVRSLLHEGFPGGLALSFYGADAITAMEGFRHQVLELRDEPASLRRLAREYQATYMVPHHLDSAGRMTRRGDRLVSCLHVVRQLAVDAARRGDGKPLADYLDGALLPQMASFRLWAETRCREEGGHCGFYGRLTTFTDIYFRELGRRLGGRAAQAVSILRGGRSEPRVAEVHGGWPHMEGGRADLE